MGVAIGLAVPLKLKFGYCVNFNFVEPRVRRNLLSHISGPTPPRKSLRLTYAYSPRMVRLLPYDSK
jgi:hypothetical protein